MFKEKLTRQEKGNWNGQQTYRASSLAFHDFARIPITRLNFLVFLLLVKLSLSTRCLGYHIPVNVLRQTFSCNLYVSVDHSV